MNDIYQFAGGLGTVLTVFLMVIVLREVVISDRDVSMKVLWAILVLSLPLLGVIIYLVFGERHHRDAADYSQIV
jgi:hypothetical protein